MESENLWTWCKNETNMKTVSSWKGWAPKYARMMCWGTVSLHVLMQRRRRIWTLSTKAQSDSSKYGPKNIDPYRAVGRIKLSMTLILVEMSWKWRQSIVSQQGLRIHILCWYEAEAVVANWSRYLRIAPTSKYTCWWSQPPPLWVGIEGMNFSSPHWI